MESNSKIVEKSKDYNTNNLENKNNNIDIGEKNGITVLAIVYDRDIDNFKYNLEYNLIQDIPDELIVILSGTKFLDYDKLIDFENKYSLLFKNFRLIKFERRKMDSYLFIEGIKLASNEIISVNFGKNFYHKKRNKILKYMFKKHNPKVIIHSFLYEYCWRQNKLINTLNLNNNIQTENINVNSFIKDKSILTVCRNYNKDISLKCSICDSPTEYSSNSGYNFCKKCLSNFITKNNYNNYPKCPVCIDKGYKNKIKNKFNFINDSNYYHYFIDPEHMKECVNCNNKNQLYFKEINDNDFENIEFIENKELFKFNFYHDLINPSKKIIFGKTNNEQIFPDTLSFTFKKELVDIFLFNLNDSLNINHCNNGFQNLLINYLLKENYKIILLNSKLSIQSIGNRYPKKKDFKFLEKSKFNILKDDFYDGKNQRSWYEYLYIDKAIYEENNK